MRIWSVRKWENFIPDVYLNSCVLRISHFLADMVREEMGDPENTGVQVYIGDEVPVRTMKDCSVVTATYELGDGMRGTIGIIGPKRMDYENVVDSLKKLKVQLDEMVNKKT